MCGLACRGGGGGIRLEDIQAGKGGIVRSFVSDCNAVETGCQVTCLILLISESQERCIATRCKSLQSFLAARTRSPNECWRNSDREKKEILPMWTA